VTSIGILLFKFFFCWLYQYGAFLIQLIGLSWLVGYTNSLHTPMKWPHYNHAFNLKRSFFNKWDLGHHQWLGNHNQSVGWRWQSDWIIVIETSTFRVYIKDLDVVDFIGKYRNRCRWIKWPLCIPFFGGNL